MIQLPPCADDPRLFESVDAVDHEQAAAICATCPMIVWCEGELDAAMAKAYPGHGPQGTWAGTFIAPRGGKAPRARIAQCGTESGYKRHMRLGEPACDKCRSAPNDARKAREQRKAAS